MVLDWMYGDRDPSAGSSSNVANSHDPDLPQGAIIADVAWRHLPNIDPFKLTDQNGDEFDSAKLAGKPYAVCFFFAQCPTICRDLIKRIEMLNGQLKKTDLQFISLSLIHI